MPLQRGDNFDTEFVKTDEYSAYRAAAFKGVCALAIYDVMFMSISLQCVDA